MLKKVQTTCSFTSLALHEVTNSTIVKSQLGFSRISNIALAFAATIVCILSIEITCRFVGFDFDRTHETFVERPPFDRLPTIPVGDVYFRHNGPEIWQGKIMSDVQRIGENQNSTQVETIEITVRYDSLGFRNPDYLTDWDIVVVGDSFTELGYLSTDDLFTTGISESLGKKVKNLGVCGVGPRTYLHYLKNYGIAKNTKHAVMVFFEGNDMGDLQRENELLKKFLETGERTYRNIEMQTSFIKALFHFVRDQYRKVFGAKKESESGTEAIFMSTAGDEIPIRVIYAPIKTSEITKDAEISFEICLKEWADISNQSGVIPSLVYMPSKRHVLNGHIKFTEDSRKDIRNWDGTDLAWFIKKYCDKYNIHFIDVTQDLVDETSKGNLTFNTNFDSHLNKHGSNVVAMKIAEELKMIEENELQNRINW